MGQIARNAAGDRPGKMAMAGREPQHVTPKPTFGDLGVRRFVSMKCWKLEVIFYLRRKKTFGLYYDPTIQ